ncbi:MAG: hypothetical protein IKP68_10900 [Clostridia bacterium]|nr:hypothetical protein [Clostridia bacterium]
MKKISAIIILFAVFALSSCGGASMSELLSYQDQSFTAEMTVSSGEMSMPVTVVKDGETYTFVLDERYTFVYGGEKWSVSYSGLSVPISKDAAKRSVPQKLLDAMTQKTGGGWKITNVEDGGRALVRCDSPTETLTIFIDAETKLPAKILCDGLECDISKIELSQK